MIKDRGMVSIFRQAFWAVLVTAAMAPGRAEAEGNGESAKKAKRSVPIREEPDISARDQAFEMRGAATAAAQPWEPQGPYGIGRISDVVVHPANDQIAYVGAASGGLYKTTNGGASFTLLSNAMKSQSIGAIAVDKTNPEIVWLGGGEIMGGGGSMTYPGAGLFKSTDGGVTWAVMGLDSTYHIGRIATHPTNSNIVLVAVMGKLYGKGPTRGVYRTTDGGSTWERVLYMNDSTGAADVRIHPTIPTRVFANFWTAQRQPYSRNWSGPACRVHRSDDGGTTWKLLGSAEGLPTSDIGKNTIDICRSNPNYMYMIYFAGNGTFKAIYKSTDGGMTWAPTSTFPPNNIYSYYAHSFGQIRVNPSDPNEVIVFGIYSYRSTNGGSTWSRTFLNNHVDHRAFAWSNTNANMVYLGHDGGLGVGTAGPNGAITDRGLQAVGGLSMAQIYNMDIAPDNSNYRYVGLQDNYVLMTSDAGATWTKIVDGDGMNVRVDHGAPVNVVGSSQDGRLQRSGSRGTGMVAITGYSGRGPWEPPIAIDSSNGMSYVGSEYVFRATRGSGTYSRISEDLSNGWHQVSNYNYGTVTTLAAHNGVVFAGTDDGNVWVSKDARAASPTWAKIRNGNSGGPGTGELAYNGWIKQITMDRSVADGSVALVAISWYRWGDRNWKPSIFKVSNFGATPADWKDISGDLPPRALTNKVIKDNAPTRAGWLYAATDYGVYYSTNGGVNWAWLGSQDLPVVAVNDINLHVATNYLYVGTYGRGLWKLNLGAVTPVSSAALGAKGIQVIRNFPNPVSLSTRIEFKVAEAQNLRVALYDYSGRLVRTLLDGKVEGGRLHAVTWNRTDEGGSRVEAGNYILRAIGSKVTLARNVEVR